MLTRVSGPTPRGRAGRCAAAAVVGAFLFLVSACSTSSGVNSQAVSSSVATAIAAAMSGGSGATMSMVGPGTARPGLPIPGGTASLSGLGRTVTTIPISSTSTGGPYSVSGSETIDTTSNPNTFAFDVTITFTNYTDDNVTIDSGSVTINENISDDTSTNTVTGSGSETGTFDVTYQGSAYTMSWSIQFSFGANGALTYSGTYTINGQTHSM